LARSVGARRVAGAPRCSALCSVVVGLTAAGPSVGPGGERGDGETGTEGARILAAVAPTPALTAGADGSER